MTHNNQTCRCWIEKKPWHRHWYSHVTIYGKTHTLSTYTKIRRAAREFNILHLRQRIKQHDESKSKATDRRSDGGDWAYLSEIPGFGNNSGCNVHGDGEDH